MNVYTIGIKVFHIFKYTAAFLAKFHNIAYIFAGGINVGAGHRFLCLCNQYGIGIIGWVIYHNYFSVCFCNTVNNTWSCCNNI